MDCLGSPTRKTVCEWPSQRPGEELDELVLAGGGVLHLVDEEVFEVEAGGEAEVFDGIFGVAVEGSACEQGEFGEVALIAGSEDELEFDQGAAEDAEEGFGDGPLLRGIADRRKRGELEQRFAKDWEVADVFDEVDELLLLWRERSRT